MKQHVGTCNDPYRGHDDDCDATAAAITATTDLACRQKLIDWKFDPIDVSRGTDEWYTSPLLATSNIFYGARISPPIVLFAQLGDCDMLRYILRKSRYATREELRRTDECGLFPLYTAISEPHTQDQILDVCQWLFKQGADLQQLVGNDWSPLARACLKGYDKVALWLIQSGALLRYTSGNANNNDDHDDDNHTIVFDSDLAQRDLPRFGVYNVGGCDTLMVTRYVHEKIFAWARQILVVRESFWWVLMGTVQRSVLDEMESGDDDEGGDPCHNKTACTSLCTLNSHPGLLEHIAGFVGVTTSRKILCTVRGLVAHHDAWWCRKVTSSSREMDGSP
eukprot:scaffold22228_cov78-Amphora_coffeaeformis.AAC.3